MKKITLLFIAMFCFAYTWQSNSQVTIGTANNGSGTTSTPFAPYYGYNYSQTIYLASEINASGDITSLDFQLNTGTSITSCDQMVDVWIGHTAKTQFDSTTDWVPVASLTQVLTSGTVTAAGNILTITFSSPFTYNGTDNLIIVVDANEPGFGVSADYVRQTTGPSNTTLYQQSDSANANPLTPPTGVRKATRGNITINGIAQSCPLPAALTASNILTNSADLGWTENGTSTNWDIEWGIDGFTPTGTPNVNDTGDNPYELTGLTASTPYDFYVRADCGADDTDVSPWVGPFSFTTACDVFSLPFAEEFSSGVLPNCWVNTSSNTVANGLWKFAGNPDYDNGNTRPAGTFAWVDGSDPSTISDVTLITPTIDVSSLTTPYVEFDYFSNNSFTYPNNILTVDVYDGTSWTTIYTDNTSSSEWRTIGISLGSFSGSTLQIRFVVDKTAAPTGNAFYNDIVLDNVSVLETPSCPDPISLTASNVTSASADLGWTENGTSTNWDIEWGTDGFVPTGTPNVNDTGDNPYELTGLSADTDYDFYVRSDCGADDTSDVSAWVGPFSFSTLVSCPAPTALTASNITTTSADLGWTENGTSMNWDIEWGVDGFAPTGTPNVNDTGDNPYELTGLTAATAYDFYVRTDCGADDTSDVSVWVGPFSFNTSCDATAVPYVQNFNASASIPLCTTVTNEGTGAYQWGIVTVASYGFTANHLRIRWDASHAANSWFFTQGLNLTGGVSYSVSYDYGGTGATFPEKLRVAYGTSQTSVAMVNPLADHPNVINDTPINNSVNFTPASTGVYYIGFQAYSDADQFYLHLDNISVDVTLSNPEVDNLNGFTYFPNPVKNTLQLNAQSNIQNVSVYNMLGQEVLRTAPNNVNSTVDMSAMQTGAYFVKVTINDRTETVRVIKQ